MKKYYFTLLFTLCAFFLFGQSTINITTSGGSWNGERWTSVTTAVNGGGTVVWSQGANIGDNAGDINVDISIAAGTYFVNCYDTYGDGWNGGLITVTDYAGNVIGDNGGVTPNNGTAGSNDLEASFQIIVPAAPSCNAPTALASSNVTATSADVSWTAGGTETEWWLVVNGAGQSVTNTTNSLTLSAATTHSVQVAAICGVGDTSVLSSPISFTTPGTCGLFQVDLVDSYGDGWNGNGLVVSINGTIYDTLTLFSGANGSFSIPVNIGDVLDFDWVLDAYATGGNTWPGENSYSVYDVSGALVGSGTFDAAAGEVNDVMGVTACPACTTPSGIMASNITTNSADVSWTAGGTETEWWFVLNGV
ncbi:MAG: fibronectin type III domain-containing protein, partial [Bacteroidota bacterium]|nr:fibronectin type III domain-containing protein [Bacteroidota bacterium]